MRVYLCVWGGVNVHVYVHVHVHVPWPECGDQRAASDVGPHIFHLVCGSVSQAAGPPASRHSRVLLLTLPLERWACRCVLPGLDLYGSGNLNTASPHRVLR